MEFEDSWITEKISTLQIFSSIAIQYSTSVSYHENLIQEATKFHPSTKISSLKNLGHRYRIAICIYCIYVVLHFIICVAIYIASWLSPDVTWIYYTNSIWFKPVVNHVFSVPRISVHSLNRIRNFIFHDTRRCVRLSIIEARIIKF